jgi:hypothetical protein
MNKINVFTKPFWEPGCPDAKKVAKGVRQIRLSGASE